MKDTEKMIGLTTESGPKEKIVIRRSSTPSQGLATTAEVGGILPASVRPKGEVKPEEQRANERGRPKVRASRIAMQEAKGKVNAKPKVKVEGRWEDAGHVAGATMLRVVLKAPREA